MTVGAIAPEMDDFRWHRIITLLSLDVVRPFYDMMGLRLIAADHFQQILHYFLTACILIYQLV